MPGCPHPVGREAGTKALGPSTLRLQPQTSRPGGNIAGGTDCRSSSEAEGLGKPGLRELVGPATVRRPELRNRGPSCSRLKPE